MKTARFKSRRTMKGKTKKGKVKTMMNNRTMENNEIKMMILNKLSIVEYTHVYAFAIRDSKMVKAVIIENANDILPMITVCELTSKSHGNVYGVRIWNSKKAFETMKAYAREIITLCTIEEFERRYKEEKEKGFKGNRGNLFEVMFSEVTGAVMNDNPNAKCTNCGDVRLNGEEIQLKLWNATVTTEPQVNRFIAEMNKAE